MEQTILTADRDYAGLDEWLCRKGIRRPMLVCDGAFPHLAAARHLERLKEQGLALTTFRDFAPNPAYEAVAAGVRRFREENCDAVLAIGGGSAMDVGKCIKLWALQGDGGPWYKQTPVCNEIPLLAMPTTAGTGSEATRYAVIYAGGTKLSVTHDSIVPEAVIFDPSALRTLPAYQRRATMMDALCHAVESCWSVHSTADSRKLSGEAIRAILGATDGYLRGEDEASGAMLRAANTAGKAINITQTTAGHAMCYKLTTLYGIAHGHAAALCVDALFPWMLRHPERICDPRGAGQVRTAMAEISEAMGCETPEEAAVRFHGILKSLALPVPDAKPEDLAVLTASVNPERLRNHPYALDAGAITALYRTILNGGEA